MSVIRNYVSFAFILFLCFHLIIFSSSFHIAEFFSSRRYPDVYFNKTVETNPIKAIKYWVDIDKMPNVSVSDQSKKVCDGPAFWCTMEPKFRRPPPVNLTFEFPYFGHPINNVTIATEGFLHLGNPMQKVFIVHQEFLLPVIPNWPPVFQKVIPLQSFFGWSEETTKIKYAGNSTIFVVQWENATIVELPQKFFTFQVSLFPNGDIVFVYKNLPIAFKDIPTDVDFLEAGLSDAYLFDRTINGTQRTILNPYYRTVFHMHSFKDISNNASIYWSAKPTCNTLVNRESCLIGIKGFRCEWCSAVGRCSDGYDRMRQQWLHNDCPTYRYDPDT